MSSPAPGALSRAMARAAGSPFAKPVARVVLVAAGLVLLAIIGRVTSAGASRGTSPAAVFPADAALDPPLDLAALGGPGAAIAPPTQAASPSAEASAAPAPSPHAAHGSATPEDPVYLNVATADDLRRLPGVGPKRAEAILALRSRLGRFRAVEDLLKVKGIGRATLKRLRPLVRLEVPAAPASADAGAATR